jgi:trans-2,3-dihydro-3-hydroxyanthranilate isomerase
VRNRFGPSARAHVEEGPTERDWPYIVVDRFTSRALAGNAPAVFPDAQSLASEEMQAVAREMRLAETTFVIPRGSSNDTARAFRTRVFTVREEMPFAGHPTLGTAFVLHVGSRGPVVTLDLPVGRIPVRFEPVDDRPFGEMTQAEPKFGSTRSPDRVAEGIGTEPSNLASEAPIRTVSTGNPVALVPFRALETLPSLRPDGHRMSAYRSTTDARFFYLVGPETVDPHARGHARMIFYDREDPATGSAAGPAIAWRGRYGLVRPEERVVIEPGVEIRRPSQTPVVAGARDSAPTNVRFGGLCVEVARGRIRF